LIGMRWVGGLFLRGLKGCGRNGGGGAGIRDEHREADGITDSTTAKRRLRRNEGFRQLFVCSAWRQRRELRRHPREVLDLRLKVTGGRSSQLEIAQIDWSSWSVFCEFENAKFT
jgi:hypothetical protein